MLGFADYLLRLIDRKRRTIALSFFLFGSPIVYFIRDFLGVFKGSQGFTTLVLGVCLIFLLPHTLPKKVYVPNFSAYFFNLSFLGLAIIYLFAYAPNRGWFTNTSNEIKYFSFILFTYAILLTISTDSIKDKFVDWTLLFCTFGALMIIYVVIKDPNFALGMRASVKFQDPKGGDGGEIGNPHVFAKVAMVGVSSLLALWKFDRVFISRLVMIGLFFVFLIVMALTMSMVYTLSLVMILGIFFLFNFNPNIIKSITKWIFGWQGFSLFVVLVGVAIYVVNYTLFVERAALAIDIIFGRFDRILNTIVNNKKELHYSTVDYSAAGRVEGIKKVFSQLVANYESNDFPRLILGNGYQQLYVDSPIFQSYHDLGIVGFILYTSGLVWIVYCALLEIKKPTNPFLLLIAFYTLHQLTSSFTGGMPYSYEWWAVMAFAGRFLIRYTPKKTVLATA